ncbi:MAG: hypothetical protein ACI95C_002760 [Pseudohongiellaceae bacterium]|jgi:hypothetical protein
MRQKLDGLLIVKLLYSRHARFVTQPVTQIELKRGKSRQLTADFFIMLERAPQPLEFLEGLPGGLSCCRLARPWVFAL